LPQRYPTSSKTTKGRQRAIAIKLRKVWSKAEGIYGHRERNNLGEFMAKNLLWFTILNKNK